MQVQQIPAWKKAPFLRLLLPFSFGILLQWYCPIPIVMVVCALLSFTIAGFLLQYLPLAIQYLLQSFRGLIIQLIIMLLAMLITWHADMRNNSSWYGHQLQAGSTLVLRISAPPEQKLRSIKTEADVLAVMEEKGQKKVSGKLLVYFPLDETSLQHGDLLLINAPLLQVKNSGNPGAFDYSRYAAFQGIFQQVFLKKGMYQKVGRQQPGYLSARIFAARAAIVSSLQKYLPADKKISGLAEALLIGYKQDLDPELVRAYSNTGVVHIIAISGLHLGLIYMLLLWIFTRLPGIKKSKLGRAFLILGCLWLFALLTGASASVLRSAVMFTCIVIGKNFFRETSVYNSLAASAFVLLCYNPYFLWDVGFQLSYLAVVGIVWLQRPIYRCWYCKHGWIRKIWEMAAVTIAAQIVSFPICIFYFHQFPNLFLLTNLLAVPLSTLILFAEILLLLLCWNPLLASLAGKGTALLIQLMNGIIETFDRVPFAVTDAIYASVITTFLLYMVIFSAATAMLQPSKKWMYCSFFSLCWFCALMGFVKVRTSRQQQLIVYNITRHSAVDFIRGNEVSFSGDSAVLRDPLLFQYNIKPARVLFMAHEKNIGNGNLLCPGSYGSFGSKKILWLDKPVDLTSIGEMPVDVLLISRNARVDLTTIIPRIGKPIVVPDASNSLWKIAYWKKQCEQLLLRCHAVSESGAFILDAK
ncbi:MAG: ComEC/Rec2-related protein [Ferruginibacter sp.]|nr:ComEC/Rec2-related protein [Ferruginibacter sp.]